MNDKVPSAAHFSPHESAGRAPAEEPLVIDVISDTICPWCFIGKRRLEQALARHPLGARAVVRWHPFELNPDMPAEGMDRSRYVAAKFGGAERAQAIYDRIRAVGQEVGLELDFGRIPRTPNTFASHRLLHLAGQEGCQDAVAEALFRAAFLEGRDIGRLETLLEVAQACGLDRDAVQARLESDADVEQVRAEEAQARELGVTGVPFFVFGGRYAVAGAQEPEVFVQVLERLASEEGALAGEAH